MSSESAPGYHDLSSQQTVTPGLPDEPQRLQTLRSLGILDTPPTAGFDALARMAALAAGTSAAMINLVDADRVWAKAQTGLPRGGDLPRAHAPCSEVVARSAPLCIEDARVNAQFARHPAVAGGSIRGYAGVPIRMDDGSTVGTVCAIHDQPRHFDEEVVASLRNVALAAVELLEARGRAEHARQERRQLDAERLRLANIIEGTRAGTWEWNVQTGAARFNERWASMVGWRLDELEPVSFQTWQMLVHPEDIVAAGQALARHFADPSVDYDFEGRMRHRGGHWIWINYRGRVGTRTADGRPEWMFGVHLDITQRKAAETALQRTRQVLEMVNEVARIGQWELDLVAGRLQWSRMTKEIHEVESSYEPDLASAIGFYATQDSRERIERAVQRALETDAPFDLELQIRTAKGQVRWVRAVGLVERDSGVAVRLHGSFHDINDRVQAQQRQRERERIEQANLAQRQFIARMSHELRTPLNAMLGFTQLLQVGKTRGDDARQQAYLQHVEVAGRHLLALVDDLLDLSRVEAGSLRLDLQLLDVAALVQQVASELGALAEGQGVRIVAEVGKGRLALADATRLRQVLHNLVSNAIRYNRPDGEVRVQLTHGATAEGAPLDAASLASESEHGVRVTVEDTGIGMNAQQLRSLFQPFNRLGRESGPVSGTGLGLTIAQHLLQLMGSELQVDSVEGEGSRFSFTLPGASPTGPAPSAQDDHLALALAESGTPQAGSSTVGTMLYVDDDEVNRTLMQAVMQLRPRVRLILAGSGAEGEALVCSAGINLALLDMMLPDMSGTELLQRIRRHADAQGLPCVVVSANAQTDDIDAALAAGFADYITKPIDLDALLATVDRYLCANGTG